MSAARALARPDIIDLEGYSHAAWLPQLIRLHANEAPWRPAGDDTRAGLNRYPEPQPQTLIQALAQLFQVAPEQILATRGSDEAIDVLSRVFLRAGEDAILQFTPTFGMYAVAAKLQGAKVVERPLDKDRGWTLPLDQLRHAWTPNIKMLYLCSPNNPTANRLSDDDVHAVCAEFSGRAVIVIDEAYIEWCGATSFAAYLDKYETLVVLRTLSKAHALAGARCGALVANTDIVRLARSVLPPYCLAQPTIEAALRALEPQNLRVAEHRIRELVAAREQVARELAGCSALERVWPSDTNFLMVDCREPQAVLDASMAAGFIVRDLRSHASLPRSLRITIGEPAHNLRLLQTLRAA